MTDDLSQRISRLAQKYGPVLLSACWGCVTVVWVLQSASHSLEAYPDNPAAVALAAAFGYALLLIVLLGGSGVLLILLGTSLVVEREVDADV